VPELRLVVEGVQDGRCVALADAALDSDRGWFPVGEGARGIMARAAGNAPVGRQATVEEQALAERDPPGGLRIVGGDRRASLVGSSTDLSKGLGPGART